MDYISREEILAEYDRQHKGPAGGARKIMETWPAADVAPVRHGEWIVDREFGNDVMSGEQMVICSVCHKGIFWGKQTYCPNCGAKME